MKLEPILEIEEIADERKGFFQRIFGKMYKGSLRLVVINLCLCGTTGSFFWYPYFLQSFGVYVGIIALIVCCFLSYQNCHFIAEASCRYEEDEYLLLIKKVIGKQMHRLARLTYLLDYLFCYIIGFLLYWNILQYLLYYWQIFDDSMRSSTTELQFKPFHPKVLLCRSIALGTGVIILIPLFLKQNMHGIKYIFFSYVGSFSTIIIYLFCDLQEFREEYTKTGELEIFYTKSFDRRVFQFFSVFISGYYVQSVILTMKKDLYNPTLERLKKTINYSHLFFITFALLFGIYGYFCLGDKYTSPLFMLRQSFQGKRHEYLYRGILFWTAINALIFLSFFNLSCKNHINTFFQERPNQKLVIFIPLFLAAMLSWVYPKIEKLLGFSGIFIVIANGFIFPTFMKRKMDIEDGCGFFKRQYWNLRILFYIAVAIVSFQEIMREEFKS